MRLPTCWVVLAMACVAGGVAVPAANGTRGLAVVAPWANATGARRLSEAPPRPSSVAAVGAAPKAIILFTHLRRCGGSFVEDVLSPASP